MSGLLRTVASLPTPEEAHAVRLRLGAEGIEALLADETTAGIYWLYSGAIGGVKVQVAENDYVRAMRVLEGEDGEENSPEWKCGRCGADVDAGFDVCWSCGALRAEAAAPVGDDETASPADPVPAAPSPFESPSDMAPPLPPQDDDGLPFNPYRSPRHSGPPPVADQAPADVDTEEGDAAALRAARSAIIGFVFCPGILHGYSAYLLLKIGLLDLPLGPRGKRLFAAALAFDLLAAAAAGVGLALMR